MASDSFSRQVAQWQKQLDRKAREMNVVQDQSSPQFPEDRRGQSYNNDTPNTWVRGANEDGRPPHFDNTDLPHHVEGRRNRGYKDASIHGAKANKVKP